MRTFMAILVVISVGCDSGQGSRGFEGEDGGDQNTEILKDSEVQDSEVQDSEVQDSEEDTEILKDSEIEDSEVEDSSDSEVEDSSDSEIEDSSDSEIEDSSDSEIEESESCVFSEKGDYRCVGQTIERCLEDPDASTIQLIWQSQWECSVGTECIESQSNVVCVNIGECSVGSFKCGDDQLKECIYDDELGGGVWSVSDDCVAKDQKCSSKVLRCVDLDWEYCNPSGPVQLTTKCEENVIFKCEVDTWVEVKDCGALTCGFDNEATGWVCYDQCIYQCLPSKVCSLGSGTVVYGVGQCLNDDVCCKR